MVGMLTCSLHFKDFIQTNTTLWSFQLDISTTQRLKWELLHTSIVSIASYLIIYFPWNSWLTWINFEAASSNNNYGNNTKSYRKYKNKLWFLRRRLINIALLVLEIISILTCDTLRPVRPLTNWTCILETRICQALIFIEPISRHTGCTIILARASFTSKLATWPAPHIVVIEVIGIKTFIASTV